MIDSHSGVDEQVRRLWDEGVRCHVAGHFHGAVEAYERVLATAPAHFDAWHMCGVASLQLARQERGILSLRRALIVDRYRARAYENYSIALLKRGSHGHASEFADRALILECDRCEPYIQRGKILARTSSPLLAMLSFTRALTLNPCSVEALVSSGNAEHRLSHVEDAVDLYRQAVVVRPDQATAYYNAGVALHDLREFSEAISCYLRCAALEPAREGLTETLFLSKMYVCDWEGWLQSTEHLMRSIESGSVSIPWAVLSTIDDPRAHLRAADAFATSRGLGSSTLQHRPRKMAESVKIKVGYFSADFHNHATAYLLAEVLESHDRERFTIYAFSFGPESDDEMRCRIRAAVDEFFDVRGLSDADIASLARSVGIDIAVDLKGYTRGERAGIFAVGCAPIQINFLGYPGSMGTDAIDYIIADETVLPTSDRRFYREKVVYLPVCYQPNDSKRRIAEQTPGRQQVGLPERGIVFCCFNVTYKINAETFAGWMRIIKAVPFSVLWLIDENPSARSNLVNSAASHGVGRDRLIFAPRATLPEHLARLKLADLFLDTFPYTAHTTASDALWAGVPVLTRIGRSFPSRVAASLLRALGLEELITTSQVDFEARAVELANSPLSLERLRRRILEARMGSPLFDGGYFARRLESAFDVMTERARAGLPPDDIWIRS